VALPVDIWSDIACPWCYIGKRRFEAALERFAHRDEVTVEWHAFELDPNAPRMREGSHDEALAAKLGMSVAEAEAMHRRMTEMAAAEGLEYRFDRVRGGNTFDAHRMIKLAGEHGLAGEMKERLMAAYFTEGIAIGDRDALAELAAEVGVSAAAASTALAGGRYSAEVREDESTARRLGISGVPFFVLGRRYGVSGAQPAELLLEALETAYDAAAGADAAA
jgi:predicted DsbA family dithiol-disulfide isomerase